MNIDEELRRAGEARQILDARMFQEARKSVEDQLATARQRVPIRDTEMHTRLILMEQLWSQLTGFLEQTAQTGKFAELHLEEERRKKSKLADAVAMFRMGGRNGL